MSSTEVETDPGPISQIVLIPVLGCHTKKRGGKSKILEPGQKIVQLDWPEVERLA